jgi:hypothetical protein
MRHDQPDRLPVRRQPRSGLAEETGVGRRAGTEEIVPAILDALGRECPFDRLHVALDTTALPARRRQKQRPRC